MWVSVRRESSRCSSLMRITLLRTWASEGQEPDGAAERISMSVPDRPVPHPNSYWLPGERVLAGEYPGAKDRAEAVAKLRCLLEAGGDSFIDLTGLGELSPYEAFLREE